MPCNISKNQIKCYRFTIFLASLFMILFFLSFRFFPHLQNITLFLLVFFFHHGFSNSIRMLLSRWSCKCICWSPITCAMYVKHAHIIQIFAVLLLKIRMVNGFKTTVDLAVQRVLFFFRCQLENDRIGIFLFDGH